MPRRPNTRTARRSTLSATRADSRCTWPPKCASVTGVDSSRPALEMAEKNAALNGRELEWIEGNAFDLLKGLRRREPAL